MALSATETAFEGFRIARERPLAVVAWMVLQLVFNLGLVGVLVWRLGPEANQINRTMLEILAGGGDATALRTYMPHMVEMEGLVLLLALIINSVMSAGVYRVVLRPQDRGFLGLKLGLDEVRQAGVLLILFVLSLAVGLSVLIIGGVFAGVAGAAGPVAGGLASMLVFAAAVGLALWLAVRLSFAGALSFQAERVDVLGAWRLTRGRFASLLGAYALAAVMALVVFLLVSVVGAAIAGLIGGVSSKAAAPAVADFSSFANFFTPLQIVDLVLTAVIGGLTTAILTGAVASAFRQIQRDTPRA
jgi:hypothetical protein